MANDEKAIESLNQHEREFVFEAETPGCIRYKEVEKPGQKRLLRQVYVEKWAARSMRNVKVNITLR